MFGISVISEQSKSALGQAATPSSDATKAAIKSFLEMLRVAPREKVECSMCWE